MARRTPRRILIVLLGAIGDVTRALPLLCRLKRGYPETEFHWAVEPTAAPLLQGHPALSGTIVFRRSGGAVAFAAFLRAIRALEAEWTLDLQRHLKSGVVSFASGAPRRVGFGHRNSREGNFLFQTEHLPAMPHFSSKLEQFLRFADHLGAPASPIEFGLSSGAEEEEKAAQLLADVGEPFAAVFVGSTAESRLWFPSRTAAVIDALGRRGLATVLVGAAGEERWAHSIEARAGARVCNLVGRTGLRDLIAIFGRARVALGPDCGPMHIAAAVGVPVISLWGATNPRRSAPYGSAHLAVQGAAPCGPCYLKRCPIGRLCMEQISEAEVVERIDRALRREP